MNDRATWLSYEFTICQREGQWNNVAGIYIFAGLNPLGLWVPYYIGQCDSFQSRIPSHELWDKARSLGATHVHAMTVPLAADRDAIEQKLIQACHPPLNTQLR